MRVVAAPPAAKMPQAKSPLVPFEMTPDTKLLLNVLVPVAACTSMMPMAVLVPLTLTPLMLLRFTTALVTSFPNTVLAPKPVIAPMESPLASTVLTMPLTLLSDTTAPSSKPSSKPPLPTLLGEACVMSFSVMKVPVFLATALAPCE